MLLGLIEAAKPGGGGPAPTPIANSLLYGFETVTATQSPVGVTALTLSADRKVSGQSGLRIVTSGSAAQNSLTYSGLALEPAIAGEAPSSWSLVAVCVDFGNLYWNPVQNVRMGISITSGGTTNYLLAGMQTALAGVSIPGAAHRRTATGRRWISAAVANLRSGGTAGAARLIDQPLTGTRAAVMNVQTSSAAPGTNNGGDIVLDHYCVIRENMPPALVQTADDVNIDQFAGLYGAGSSVRELMKSANLQWSVYVPPSLVGTSGKMSWGNLATLRDEDGVAMCLDSGFWDQPIQAAGRRTNPGDPVDARITQPGTIAGFLQEYDLMKAAMIANLGAGITPHLDHACASYGATGYPESVPAAFSVTCDGAGTLTSPVGTNNTYASVYPGMLVFNFSGSGPVPAAGTKVGLVLSQRSFTIVNADGSPSSLAAGSFNVTVIGTAPGFTITAVDAADRTLIDLSHTTFGASPTSRLYIGMNAFIPGMSQETKVVEIVSGTRVRLSAEVPLGITPQRADFGLVDGGWWPTKVRDALAAYGIKSLRGLGSNAGLFTGFQLTPSMAIDYPALTVDGSIATNATATTLANLDEAVLNGRDIFTYFHNAGGNASTPNSALHDEYKAYRDWAQQRQNAALLVTRTVPNWFDVGSKRLAPTI